MDAQQFAPITMCLGKVTLAAGTTTTLSNTGTIVYGIRGKAYSAAALSNTATPTIDAVTGAAFVGVPANNGSIFMVGLNAAGGLLVAQGQVAALDVNGAFITAPLFGGLVLNFCPIGYIVIKCGSTASTWTFGASNMSGATGVTYTFVDILSEPDRPQIA